jgi:broad specificity phosphatase PhoE
VTSPVRRTRESAELLAAVLGKPLEEEPGFAEMEFGRWDGQTFPEVAAADPDLFRRWIGATDVAPPGGESFADVEARVLAALDRVLAAHARRTVVVVSHVTPIKTMVAHAIGAPLPALFRMELAPASVSVLTFRPADDTPRPTSSLRLYNARPPGVDALSIPATTW